ncbi:3625_t:CDS:2, partial [Acaulospora colombiana]
ETVEKILCNGDWEDENVLAVATVRYHKFMMLTEKYPDRILVPTMGESIECMPLLSQGFDSKEKLEPYTSEDPSKKWRSSSRVVMSVVFPVYGLYVAQRLWKLSKTHDKNIGPGGSVNRSMWITPESNGINGQERRGPYTSG